MVVRRFKWTKPEHDAERAVVAMALVRVKCLGISSADAVRMTLENGHHCRNPDDLPEATFIRLCRRVDKLAGDYSRREASV